MEICGGPASGGGRPTNDDDGDGDNDDVRYRLLMVGECNGY